MWLALGFVGVLVLAACGSAVQSNPDAALQNASRAGSAIPADFQIAVYHGNSVVGGEEVRFSELLGQGKPVVLNLWAGLCPPCRLEMPDLQAVSEEFSDEIVLFGLDVGPFTNLGTSEDGQRLIHELGVSYPVGTTFDADVVRAYELIGMPTTYFITPDGEIIRQCTGLLTEDKLAELVQELLEASAGS